MTPWDVDGLWLRCALHAHTTNSDGELAPEELSLDYHRYTHAKEFTAKRFEETYAWMQSWDLSDGTNSYETIVSPIA